MPKVLFTEKPLTHKGSKLLEQNLKYFIQRAVFLWDTLYRVFAIKNYSHAISSLGWGKGRECEQKFI